MLKELLVNLKGYLKRNKNHKAFSYGLHERWYKMLDQEVWSSSPEVDNLAEVLLNARERIYWKCEQREF